MTDTAFTSPSSTGFDTNPVLRVGQQSSRPRTCRRWTACCRFSFSMLFILYAQTVGSAVELGEPTSALFDTSRVLDIQLRLPDEDWNNLRQQTRSIFAALNKVPSHQSPFTYFKADLTIDDLTIRDVGVRKKGFLGSLDSQRPSLKIRFDEFTKQQPFGPLRRLSLNNNKQDPSGLSQYLTYWLFRKAGMPAPRCSYAKLTVNGDDLGIFTNVESIEGTMLKRSFGDGTGNLFEGTVADFSPDMLQRFEPKSKDANRASIVTLAEILAEDEIDLARLHEILDVPAFVRYWALESLIGFWDGYTHDHNNFFVYQNPGNGKLYFIPWGADMAFSDYIPATMPRITYTGLHTDSLLANRLYRNPEIRDLYWRTLRELLDQHWQESDLITEVDRIETMLKGVLGAEIDRFQGAAERIRKFILGRRAIMERIIEQPPLVITRGPRRPSYTVQLGDGAGVFATKWFVKSPGQPSHHGTIDLKLKIEGEQFVFSKIGVTAEPSRDPSAKGPDGIAPPTLVITGMRESDGKQMTIVLGMETARFHPTPEPVSAIGVVFEGSPMWFFAQAVFRPDRLIFVDGQVTLDAAQMKAGEEVSGKFDFRVLKMAGGDVMLVPDVTKATK
ncbi:MAG: CotH kinase family protein [Pirellulales bacterium]